MSDMNLPHIPGESGEDYAKRLKIVDAATKPFQPGAETEDERILRKGALVNKYVSDKLRTYDAFELPKAEVYRLTAEAYLEAFHSWPHDELVYLTSVLHAQIRMGQV